MTCFNLLEDFFYKLDVPGTARVVSSFGSVYALVPSSAIVSFYIWGSLPSGCNSNFYHLPLLLETLLRPLGEPIEFSPFVVLFIKCIPLPKRSRKTLVDELEVSEDFMVGEVLRAGHAALFSGFSRCGC